VTILIGNCSEAKTAYDQDECANIENYQLSADWKIENTKENPTNVVQDSDQAELKDDESDQVHSRDNECDQAELKDDECDQVQSRDNESDQAESNDDEQNMTVRK